MKKTTNAYSQCRWTLFAAGLFGKNSNLQPLPDLSFRTTNRDDPFVSYIQLMEIGALGVNMVLVVEAVVMEHKVELVFATTLLQGTEDFHVQVLQLNQEHAEFKIAQVSKHF